MKPFAVARGTRAGRGKEDDVGMGNRASWNTRTTRKQLCVSQNHPIASTISIND